MLHDARGVAHSTTSDSAIQLYETALRQFQSYRGDPLATLDAALAADPQFASAHLFKAFVLYTLSEKKYLPDVVQSLDAARALAATMAPRERQLLAAGDQLVRGEWDDASRTFDSVLQDHPRDALAVQTAHLMDFFRGDALNLRHAVAALERRPSRLFIRARHVRVRPGGMQPVSGRRACRSSGARQRTAGWLVGARGHPRDGDAGSH